MNKLVPSIIPTTQGVLELLAMELNDLEFIVLGSNSCPVVNLLCNLKQINLSSLDPGTALGKRGYQFLLWLREIRGHGRDKLIRREFAKQKLLEYKVEACLP